MRTNHKADRDLLLGLIDAISVSNITPPGSSTLPMSARRDALAAAAEVVLTVERIGRGTEGLVATVGALELSPNVANVVPGEVRMLLDVRHAEDDARARAADAIRAEIERIASARGVNVTWM